MPQVTIDYEDPNTLRMLKDVAEDWHFKILSERKTYRVNNVTITPGDPSVDISEMEQIFSGKNLDAKELRKRAWRGTK